MSGDAVQNPLGRRARAFVAAPGPHLFLRLHDERLRVYPADWTGDVVPDFVVFPCGQVQHREAWDVALPDGARARLASGKARAVFDASSEGQEHGPELSGALHGFLEHLGARPGRAVYITQNRLFDEDYRAFCAGAGERPAMTVLNYDYWIKRLLWPHEDGGEALFEHRRALWRVRARRRPRRFLSLNRSPRPTKLYFLLSLMRDGVWDQGHVSFGGFDQVRRMRKREPERMVREMRRLDGFRDLFKDLSPYLERLEALGQIEFTEAVDEPALEPHRHRAVDLGLAEYQTSWFSVVTETEMRARPDRVTEKSFKPLLNFHPMVTLGNPGSLAFLRSLGFETFPELVDETYDAVESPRERFDLAYAQVVRLCRMDEAGLARLEASLADKLEHNARVALIDLPRRYREEFDRALVDDLLAPLTPRADAPKRRRLGHWLRSIGRR